LTGTPVAGFILIHPGVQIKSVEGDALLAYRDFNEIGANFPVEAVAVHANIEGCVPESDKAGEQRR
jgi:hypothetical protein